MSRIIKLMAAALVMALAAFLFAGCGGGDEAQAPRTSTGAGTTKTTAKAQGNTDKPEDLVGQVVVPTDQTPNDFKRSLESRRPIVVTFYMTGPFDDNQVRSFITTLKTKFQGQVDFYDYLNTDGQRYGDLWTLLKVNSTPTVVCINKEAKIQRAWTGYADAKTIEQGIVESLK